MNGNNNAFYMNRIIKLISPLTCQTFKIELNGEENELRELLATILEINPKSIKGLRDSYNNYYTLSSAVKNPHINTDPYNYYTVVIKGIAPSNDLKYLKYPSMNILKRDSMYSYSLLNNNNNLINKSLDYFDNGDDEDKKNSFRYLYKNSINSSKIGDNYKNKDLLLFAEDLYQKDYIDYNLERKLKKLIKENNKEVISILNSYLNVKNKKSFDEIAKKIKPVISSQGKNSEIFEESKQDSSSSENSENNEKKSKKSKNKSKSNKNEKKLKKNNDNNNKKNVKLSIEEKILEDVKLNFSKEKYLKLKGLVDKKDKKIIKIIKNFEKNNDYNHFISKLSRLVENDSENSDNQTEEKDSNSFENDSSYYIRKADTKKANKKKNKLKSEEIQKISKNVCNSLKNKRKDLYYIGKYDMQKLKNEEKIELFTKQFNLDLDKLNKENFKIPKKNLAIISNYYSDYILKKICKNFSENEKLIYSRLLEEEDEENNIIIKYFKDLMNHKNINELKNQIKKIIKETEERIEEEENEENDEEKGQNSIKEENEENENEEDEENEEDDEEEEEEEDEEDEDNNENEKDSENKSKSKNDNDSSSNNFILKDDNKDRAVNILNNNYKKINNFSNFANNNNSNNENKDEEKKEYNNDNLGLGFVVVKQKKPNKEEEKKDSDNNVQTNNDNNNKLNTTKSLPKESSLSTNNPNKKLNQFIAQIEHMKKIDNIKKTIIDAIHSNNKYIMDLFEKFQKNKFNLNPKSLNAVYKQIKDNPDTTSKDYIFRSLIKEIPSLTENAQEFLCDEFISNKNSELEAFFSLYESSKEKDEFLESIEIFMKKPIIKKNLIKFTLNKIKSEISSNLLKKDESDNNENQTEKSREIIKILQKNNLFNEKEYNIIMNSLDKDDDVFTATFQVLFDDQDLNEFYETMTLALENQMKKVGNSEINDENWNSDLIKKNYKKIKKRIEEKHYDTLEELYNSKNENLYNILIDLNSSNINEKIENTKTLILKKELSAT